MVDYSDGSRVHNFWSRRGWPKNWGKSCKLNSKNAAKIFVHYSLIILQPKDQRSWLKYSKLSTSGLQIPASDSGITPLKTWKQPFTCPIAHSTCIRSLAIFCVFSTSAAAEHFGPLKGGMFNSVPDETSKSWISKSQQNAYFWAITFKY